MDKYEIHRLVMKTALLKLIGWDTDSHPPYQATTPGHWDRDDIYSWGITNLKHNFFWLDPNLFREEYDLRTKNGNGNLIVVVLPKQNPNVWVFEDKEDCDKFKKRWCSE